MRFDVAEDDFKGTLFEVTIYLSKKDVEDLREELKYIGSICAKGRVIQAIEEAVNDDPKTI